MKRIAEIDILRGIAIIFVLLGHAIIIYPINLHYLPLFRYFFNLVSSVLISLLFLLSGFCFRKKSDYLQYIFGKIKHIILPYLIFSMIDAIPRSLFTAFINRPSNFFSSLNKILFYGGEYWFLYTLFLIFLIAPFFTTKSEGIQCKEMIIYGISFFLGIMSLFIELPYTLCFNQVVRYFVFFYSGFLLNKSFCQLNQKYESISNFKRNHLTFIFGIMWIFAVLLTQKFGEEKWMFFVSAIIGIIFLVLSVKKNFLKKFNSFLQVCGQNSLQLYLFNVFLLVISRTLTIKVLGISNPWMILMANMIVTLFVSLQIVNILSKSEIGRVLLGK